MSAVESTLEPPAQTQNQKHLSTHLVLAERETSHVPVGDLAQGLWRQPSSPWRPDPMSWGWPWASLRCTGQALLVSRARAPSYRAAPGLRPTPWRQVASARGSAVIREKMPVCLACPKLCRALAWHAHWGREAVGRGPAPAPLESIIQPVPAP